MNTELTVLDIIGLFVSLSGLLIAFVSLAFAYAVFTRSQKNYYKKFLRLLSNKERQIYKQVNKKGIVNPLFASYLMDDIRFMGENFFVDFSADGYLKYYQYKTIKIIYNRIKKRMLISQKVFNKAVKANAENINIRVQLFGKFNDINKQYFNNKVKSAEFSRENSNIYATVNLNYDKEKKRFVNVNADKPSNIYLMPDDEEFKKNIYYVFSSSYEIEEKLDQEHWDQQFFFIACSYDDDKNVNLNDMSLSQKEKLEETTVKGDK